MNLKTKMNRQACLGIFSKTTDSAMVEVAGLGGLDFIILDTEHGPASWETIHHHVKAARLTDMSSVVRVKGVDVGAIGAAFDTGADGVQVPNINTPEQAAEAVKAARFHPLGSRGVCRFVRAAGFGSTPKDRYFKEANDKLLILQVEGLEGVRNLDAILDIPNFDVLFIGTYDLSQSIGKPGEVESPEVVSLLNEIAEKSRKKGILTGAFCDSLQVAKRLKNEGFSYIAYSVDVSIYMDQILNIRSVFTNE
ncbi:HpcH/HpaI aldolase family protein [Desulfonatronum parangueonense]